MNIDRRTFLFAAAAVGVTSMTGLSVAATNAPAPAPAEAAKGPIELPPLPWEPNALDPVISSRTVGVHYGKHHKGYVDNLNKMIADTPLAGRSLEEIVREVSGKADQVGIFNNAAQVWNHTFYWHSLSKTGGGKPGADVLDKINAAFGSFEEFQKAFLAAATGQFGSGWAWLVLDKASKKLAIVKTGNADTPITGDAAVPLAVLDVWEHAYYLDYENRRAEYATAVFEKLLNWRFVEENLAKA